jgi:hypothetical protein
MTRWLAYQLKVSVKVYVTVRKWIMHAVYSKEDTPSAISGNLLLVCGCHLRVARLTLVPWLRPEVFVG